MDAIGGGSVSMPDYNDSASEVDSAPEVGDAGDVGGAETDTELPTSTEDSASLSAESEGGEAGDSPLLGGLSDNFSAISTPSASSQDSGSSAHAEGSLRDGTYDVGAEAHSGRHKESTTQNGHTETTRSESREAHARIGTSGHLSQGKFKSEVDVGASVEVSQRGVVRGQTELAGVKLRGEIGGDAQVRAEAELRSRSEIDLSRGTVDLDRRAAVGVNGSASGHVASEVEALGVTRRDEASVGAEVDAHAEASQRFKADENGIEAANRLDANASLSADASQRTTYSTEAGSLETGVRGEARVGAEVHANSHFKSTEDTLEFGRHVGASANLSVMAEGDVKVDTANGSHLGATGGMTWGSVGAGAGGDFARRPGETSLGVEAFGSIVGGAHFNVDATIKDRDIAEAATAPLRVASGALGVIGDTAEGAGQLTESARQSANQRQEFLEEMGSVPTGNFIADTGIAAAETLHGGYTNAVELADNVTDNLTDAYQSASQNVSETAARVTDRVEETVGSAMDYGVKKVNSGYRYGRAIGGGFLQGLGQGASNIGSFLNPFD